MNLLRTSAEFATVFIFTLAFLFYARKAAKHVGLVDKPGLRKRHQGAIPLAGGVSVMAGICFAFAIMHHHIPQIRLYLFSAWVLVFVGILDDRFDVSVKIRALVQAFIALVMMFTGKLCLLGFGFILGPWEMVVGPFGYILTLFAVWASINAFNMIDGIDGLLGCLSCVTFLAMGILLFSSGYISLGIWCLIMITTITPHILFNLGIMGRRYKVFMGDAGSTLIGFTIIWILLESTQGELPAIAPVTALWLIAIPLMDMVAIMYRRMSKGMSPFAADRQHIHHLIMRAGFTSGQTLMLITLIAILLAGIGVLGQNLSFIPDWIMFSLFLLIFIFYGYCIKHAWRVARFIKRMKRRFDNRTGEG